jgi:hypothetical protein
MKCTMQLNNHVSSYITISFQIVTSFTNLSVVLPVSNRALLKYLRRNFSLLYILYILFSRCLSKVKVISSSQWFWALYLILRDLIQTQWTVNFIRRRCTIECMKLVTGIVKYRCEKPGCRVCVCVFDLYIHWYIEKFLDIHVIGNMGSLFRVALWTKNRYIHSGDK